MGLLEEPMEALLVEVDSHSLYFVVLLSLRELRRVLQSSHVVEAFSLRQVCSSMRKNGLAGEI
jgi:hypothetical protein